MYQLSDEGTMACVLPHGVLFRGSSEGHIRKFLIEDRNWLDAVIGLPANIFFGTSIPTCILVFRKQRKNNDPILFIDASQHFEKVKTQNKLREEHISKITSTYADYLGGALSAGELEEKYSYIATQDEIRENDYNLNIPRYVDTFEEEEPVDLKVVTTELAEVAEALEDTDATITQFCNELGINAPI